MGPILLLPREHAEALLTDHEQPALDGQHAHRPNAGRQIHAIASTIATAQERRVAPRAQAERELALRPERELRQRERPAALAAGIVRHGPELGRALCVELEQPPLAPAERVGADRRERAVVEPGAQVLERRRGRARRSVEARLTIAKEKVDCTGGDDREAAAERVDVEALAHVEHLRQLHAAQARHLDRRARAHARAPHPSFVVDQPELAPALDRVRGEPASRQRRLLRRAPERLPARGRGRPALEVQAGARAHAHERAGRPLALRVGEVGVEVEPDLRRVREPVVRGLGDRRQTPGRDPGQRLAAHEDRRRPRGRAAQRAVYGARARIDRRLAREPVRSPELLEAGFPRGVFSVVHGGREVVEAFCDHPEIAAVGFVGSTPV
ncbi:MAG: aldehyde dehydrogenase family protein, partial [Sandaracinaceae bacterium]|nr:aldehyde dehydrogenase family protein [Sandaracinaceae bacterium]